MKTNNRFLLKTVKEHRSDITKEEIAAAKKVLKNKIYDPKLDDLLAGDNFLNDLLICETIKKSKRNTVPIKKNGYVKFLRSNEIIDDVPMTRP